MTRRQGDRATGQLGNQTELPNCRIAELPSATLGTLGTSAGAAWFVWYNAAFLPVLYGLSRFGQAETPLALLVQMAHGLGAVALLLVVAYGRGGLVGWWVGGLVTRTHELSIPAKLTVLRVAVPVLALSAAVALLLRGMGYFNLSAFLVRGVPLTALVLVASYAACRLLLPRLMGLAEWPARRPEGWAPYAATTFPLLRGTLTVTVGVLVTAGLMEIWGHFPAARRIVDALLYVAAGGGLGGLAGTALLPWLLRPLRWLGGAWNEALVQLLSVPVAVYGLLLGVYGGVLALVPAEGNHWVGQPFRGAVIVLITYTLIRLVNGLTRHYLTLAVERGGPGLSAGLALTRKIGNLIILALGVTFVISQMGYKITPLLTSLGIAGIAVAMALQDTLANLFAGFYMMMDHSLKPGDYVKLDTGDEGFIQDIGWRNTKIRPWANNLVVLPNTKLSQSVVTNHHLPVEETSVYVGCGVSYDSDLDHVEEVCIEVAREVMAQVPGSALDWNPVVRYKEFGESNIHFVVVLRVREFAAQYLLTHEFIKALFRRFKQEGIEIAYPMRNVILRSEAGPQFRPSIRIASQE